MIARAAANAVLLLLLFPALGTAHPAPFSFLDLRITDTGVDGALIVHDIDVGHDVGVDPPERFRDPAFAALYRDQITRLMDSRLAVWLDGQRATLQWNGFETVPERHSLRLTFAAASERPGALRVNAVLFPYDPIHQTFVNVFEDGQLRYQAILDETRQAADYYAGTWQGATAVIGVFVPSGIEHILIGPDHILFLVGLLLLGGSLAKLAAIVTAFTVGHSITLSLAALDVVAPPATIIEPIIALSIVFVGADNLLVRKDALLLAAEGPSNTTPLERPRDIRAWVAGVFGLVHGFGFASVLKEFGLPPTALGWSLFSFNVGVEIGQLVIVLCVASALAAISRRSACLGRAVVLAGSVLVVAAGCYWFVERVFLSRSTS